MGSDSQPIGCARPCCFSAAVVTKGIDECEACRAAFATCAKDQEQRGTPLSTTAQQRKPPRRPPESTRTTELFGKAQPRQTVWTTVSAMPALRGAFVHDEILGQCRSAPRVSVQLPSQLEYFQSSGLWRAMVLASIIDCVTLPRFDDASQPANHCDRRRRSG